MEIWKDIEGYEGLYQVSNTGKIKALYKIVEFTDGRKRKYPEIILKPKIRTDGYYCVALYNNKSILQKPIHRLVAKAFIPNPENKPEVNHKDGNKLNNNDWNLEWNTSKENRIHAFKTGLLFAPNSKINKKHVSKIKALYNDKIMNQYQLAKEFGISQAQISRIINNKNWTDKYNQP